MVPKGKRDHDCQELARKMLNASSARDIPTLKECLGEATASFQREHDDVLRAKLAGIMQSCIGVLTSHGVNITPLDERIDRKAEEIDQKANEAKGNIQQLVDDAVSVLRQESMTIRKRMGIVEAKGGQPKSRAALFCLCAVIIIGALWYFTGSNQPAGQRLNGKATSAQQRSTKSAKHGTKRQQPAREVQEETEETENTDQATDQENSN